MKRLKVLLSAYSCEPGRGSEPGVGWNVVREVAKYHDVWVLTRPDESKEAIEAELKRNPIPGLQFVYFTLPFWQDSMRWGQSGAMQMHYYLWQIQAYFEARRLHRQVGFDVMHHVTFVKYSSPSLLSLLPVPFVWGPVGGGESAPTAFWQDFTLRAKAYETFRLVNHRIGELDPLSRLTASNSAIARATTPETAKRLKLMGADHIETYSALGLSDSELSLLSGFSAPTTTATRFISIARLLHWKGLHLSIRAFAEANLDKHAEYWILGDGPERETLVDLANGLGLGERVKFLGVLPRPETLQHLADCYALVHPSLHDSGGLVCLEAMAAGRPVICLDTGGPATQVTDQTGLKIPALNPQQAIQDLAQAMERLAGDRELCDRMGQAGKAYVSDHFSWDSKGKQLAQLYTDLVSQPQKHPDESMSCVS